MAGPVLIVIPARFASSRFPGKPLAPIAGVPMVVRALRSAEEAVPGADVVVATDDERIADVVRAAGGRATMTSPLAPSGTDRVWEVAAGHPADIVVNLQGDEPLLPAAVVGALVGRLAADGSIDMATPVVAMPRHAALSPDVVTVAGEPGGRAHYFSRSVIPWGSDPVWRHIGVYAYRRDALRRFVAAAPSVLERAERLEQLRALAIGLTIGMVEVQAVTHAVDRPDDVAVVERLLEMPAEGAAAAGAGLGQQGPIRLVVLDVDGVLTDGRISYVGGSEQLLSFDVKDGQGIVALRQAGIGVAILSARDSPALRRRAEELGIVEVGVSVTDKVAALTSLTSRLGVALGDVCYVGDDVGDVAAMALCGLSAAPADATDAAKGAAVIVLQRPGGRGAVREVADLLLGPASPPVGESSGPSMTP